MKLFDAHNHLQDVRLLPHRAEIFQSLEQIGFAGAVVNGTRESDWPAVAELAAADVRQVPSFGLHPWYVVERSSNWMAALVGKLDAHPQSAIGEIGLDRWVKGHDLDVQRAAFIPQLELAAARNRPATIHCLRAWGALWDIIREHPLPARGFLLHAYGGPAEMAAGFLDRGAYFSFSAYFLHERKAAQREFFKTLPADRLLIETDAPDMSPPPEHNAHLLADGALNHPANLALAFAALCELRELAPDILAAQLEANFARLFLSS